MSTPQTAQPSHTPRPLRWGILGCAAILEKAVLPGMKKSALLHIYALASRTKERAQELAERWGIAQTFDNYEDLLADPQVDIVYIPLPNHLHVPWALQAAKAGKHVLCEKPLATSAQELQCLLPYADKVHIAEGLMVRHHPQWHYARQLILEGKIGQLRTVQGHFSYFNDNPHNIRNQADFGGGALLDIGIYPITAARYFFGCEPLFASAIIERHPNYRIDSATSGILDFGQGQHLLFSCSTQALRYQSLSLIGTQGQIDFDLPFNPLPDQAAVLWLASGNQMRHERERIEIAACDQFQLQAEHFTHQVQSAAPSAAALQNAMAGMRTIDALFASAQSGHVEPV